MAPASNQPELAPHSDSRSPMELLSSEPEGEDDTEDTDGWRDNRKEKYI